MKVEIELSELEKLRAELKKAKEDNRDMVLKYADTDLERVKRDVEQVALHVFDAVCSEVLKNWDLITPKIQYK